MLYQWDKSSLIYSQVTNNIGPSLTVNTSPYSTVYFYVSDNINFDNVTGMYTLNSNPSRVTESRPYTSYNFTGCFGYSITLAENNQLNKIYYPIVQREILLANLNYTSSNPPRSSFTATSNDGLREYSSVQTKNTFIENVYSIDPNAFPENGVSNNYWYLNKKVS